MTVLSMEHTALNHIAVLTCGEIVETSGRRVVHVDRGDVEVLISPDVTDRFPGKFTVAACARRERTHSHREECPYVHGVAHKGELLITVNRLIALARSTAHAAIAS